MLSPFRLQVGIRGLGFWSVGESLVFAFIVLFTVLAAIRTYADGALSGIVAEFPLVITFMLASRNSVWTILLGLPFDRAIFWHKYCAWSSIILGAIHAIYAGLHPQGIGAICEIAMALLGILAWGPIRRKFWEFFLRAHWVLFILTGLTGIWHGMRLVIVGVLFWQIDLFIRYFYQAHLKYPKSAELKRLPAGVVRLKFQKGNFRYKSGQYIFICIPEISIYEWHPFSISSSPYEEEVSIHIRALGDWTKKLHNLAQNSRKVSFLMEGPCGNPAVDLDGSVYKHFLLVSGGIGITPLQSVCNDLMHQYHARERDIKTVWFLWTARDKYLADAVLNDEASSTSRKASIASRRLPKIFSPDLLKELGVPSRAVFDTYNELSVNKQQLAEEVLLADFYLTRAKKNKRSSYSNITPELMPNLSFGRPDLLKVFSQMTKIVQASELQETTQRVAVCVCGPSVMVREVRSLCFSMSTSKVSFDFHSEEFEF